MKKLIIACMAVAGVSSLANATVLYNTMDDLENNGYYDNFDWMLSPNANYDPSDPDANPVIDDVKFAQDVKLTDFSCYVITDGILKPSTTTGKITLDGTILIRHLGLDGKTDAVYDENVLLTVVPISIPYQGGFAYLLSVSKDLTTVLDQGTYYFGLQIIWPDDSVRFRFAGNEKYYIDDLGQKITAAGENALVETSTGWTTWNSKEYSGDSPTNLSFKVEGDYVNDNPPSVPGPAAIVPFGIGLAAALRRRRK